jgi:hypothetical protein
VITPCFRIHQYALLFFCSGEGVKHTNHQAGCSEESYFFHTAILNSGVYKLAKLKAIR